MYERNLNEAESILRTQKKPLVPVSEIWEEVVRRSKIEGFEVATLPDFSTMLEGDRRFQIIPAQIKHEEDQEGPAEETSVDTEMENLGFFSEDQVKLRTARVARSVTSEDEEEVGSIRRRAFVSRPVQTKKIAVKKKKTSNISTKSAKKEKNKKSSSQKPKLLKRTNSARNKKSKTRLRGKK